MQQVVLETHIPGLKRVNRGKVRDIYEIDGTLLIVATDRISAFDCILPTGIPEKGRVLTAMTLFWLEFLKDITPNHLLSADVGNMGMAVEPYAAMLNGRSMLVEKANVIPIECVVRGYLAGSAWKEYSRSGTVCGAKLPRGLQESDELPDPIFTPSTKATTGHDENISFERMADLVGRDVAETLRDNTLAVYREARDYARGRGVIIADTKLEWGRSEEGRIMLIDEVLTPDSSRFWPADRYAPGRAQDSFDKQFVRDWLSASGWNCEPPAPQLPEDVIRKTSQKYLKAYEILTGHRLGEAS